MEPIEVSALVRERLGMEVQAVSLVRSRSRTSLTPRIWTVMTEHGHFWLVEDNGIAELFRMAIGRGSSSGVECATAAEASRKFLELHPEARSLDEDAVSGGAEAMSYACQVCGAVVTRRRRTDQMGRRLCKRCRHAERERVRYRDDPEYRARRLAYSTARYRKMREVRSGQHEHASDDTS